MINLNFSLFEKRAGKKAKGLLLHKATGAGIKFEDSKFVISIKNDVAVHLFSGNAPVREIELREITNYYGKTFEPEKISPFRDYMNQLAKDNEIPAERLNIIICEKDGKMGCHLYNGGKYIKRIPTLELLNKFNSEEQD